MQSAARYRWGGGGGILPMDGRTDGDSNNLVDTSGPSICLTSDPMMAAGPSSDSETGASACPGLVHFHI